MRATSCVRKLTQSPRLLGILLLIVACIVGTEASAIGEQREASLKATHGRAALLRGQYQEANDLLTEALESDALPVPTRIAALGNRGIARWRLSDPHAAIDDHADSLDGLLELSARHEAQGLGDAPWPPQYKKQQGEPPRVQPSRARGARASKHPLIEIGRARRKEDALAGLERWKARHPKVAGHLEPADVLVDAMRGRWSTWTRVRVNLRHVPAELRPAQEPLDPDESARLSP